MYSIMAHVLRVMSRLLSCSMTAMVAVFRPNER
jgi:hypothetical protein